MTKEIIINHMDYEIRVAIRENNVLTEIFYERPQDKSVVGNIYKGKILKVLPGMEAAFVDIGLSKAAFLYVDDIQQDEDIESLDENDESTSSSVNKKRPNINELIKEGESILVQVSKGPISTKGARVVCNISLPGRNLVLTPYSNSIGISRQINDRQKRNALKKIINRIKTPDLGLIVRTVAEGRSEEELHCDFNYLVKTWNSIEEDFKKQKAPALLNADLNLTFRTMRDMLSREISSVIIDNQAEYNRLLDYITNYMPHYTNVLKLFKKNTNIFDYYGIEIEIEGALSRKVWLKSGGYLIIDQAEALTAVDVNTGRFTGSNSHEDTIVQTNLEAVKELVYQLKLRDMGGIIIIDLIDMEDAKNRTMVYQVLKEELKKDKARSKILTISEMGLIEMTRKRSQENLASYLCSPCPYCENTGLVKSFPTVVYEISREITKIIKQQRKVKNLLLLVHIDIANYLEEKEKDLIPSLQKSLGINITIRISEKLHIEQYEVFTL